MTEATASRGKPVYKGEDYHSKFDPKDYLGSYYTKDFKNEPITLLMLESFHEFCQRAVPNGAKVLDLGCGPCLNSVISASSKSNNIICAEYTESNRAEIIKWLSKDKDAFDWSPVLKHVTVLEGKSEAEWKATEQRVRSAIKQVIPCDVTKESIFEDTVISQCDLVITSLCLEAACDTYNGFCAAVRKIADILKPGGHIITVTVLGESFYHCGQKPTSNKFFALPLSEEMVLKALKEAGFVVTITKRLKVEQPDNVEHLMEFSDFTGALILMAKTIMV